MPTTITTPPYGTFGEPFVVNANDSQTTQNTCPGTVITSDPGIVIEVKPQSVAANGSIVLFTLPPICMITGMMFYEIWLKDEGYICGQEMFSCNVGLKTFTNMSQHSAADPSATGIALNYKSNPVQLVLGTSGEALQVTGGRVVLMGMMYSNP